MRIESLFSSAGKVFEWDLWGILVRYVNGEDEAIEEFRKLLRRLDYGPRVPQGEGLPPRPIVGPTAKRLVTDQAVEDRENARDLLNWFADPIGNVRDKELVVRILNERQGHYRRTYGPFPGGRPAEQTPRQLQFVFEFDRPIDLICALLSEQLAHGGAVATVQSLLPIRICGQCGKLFVRNRKSRFCPGGKCKSAHDRRRPQRANATYQFKRRVLRLRRTLPPKRFAAVVSMTLDHVRHRKMERAEKMPRICFLKEQLKAVGK